MYRAASARATYQLSMQQTPRLVSVFFTRIERGGTFPRASWRALGSDIPAAAATAAGGAAAGHSQS